VVAGSPPYMAPEQARGQGERVDARTDVYGLGAVLYYLLTGQPPHDGKTLIEALEKARDAPIVPPRRLNRRIPRALEGICLKALASDPKSRFPTADALGRALRHYMQMRRAVPVLGILAVVLALLVPVWAFRRGSAPEVLKPEPKRVPQAGPRVTHFEIPHFPKLDADHFDERRIGTLGRTSFAAHEDDEVTVRSELSEPAYSYLISFRPDGADELCEPYSEDLPPPRKQQPLYPPPSKSDERYRLSEGTGLQAFALVVSREPLPPYREWKKQHGPMPWRANLPCEPGIVWRDDDQGLQPLVSEEAAGTRGKGVKGRGSGAPAAKLASWLRGRAGVDTVTLEAFPIEPAPGP
jgi:hypothetical protein